MARRSPSHRRRRPELPRRNSRGTWARRSAALLALAIGLLAAVPFARAQIRADTGSIAIGGTVTNSTISVGVAPEQLAILIRTFDETSVTHKKYIAKLESELDLNQRQIQAAFAILGEVNVPEHQIAAKLVEFAARLKDLQQLAERAKPGEDPKITALRRDSRAALGAGDLDKADALLTEVGAEQRRARERLALDEAENWAERAKIAKTRLRYRDAARYFAEAAATLPAGETFDEARIGYLNNQAEAFFQLGYDFGDRKAMQAALDVRTHLVEMTRARATLDALKLRFLLAMTTSVAARRQKDEARLKEAIAAYRALLVELEQFDAPFDRAVVQYHLAIALRRVAAYEEEEIERLEEAAQAFKNAVKGFAEVGAFRLRTYARMGLTRVLVTIDVRAEGRTPNFERALEQHRAAVANLSRERHPALWVAAQVNIGNALANLGAQKKDTEKLEEAIAAYRGALEVVRRDRRPLLWAEIQVKLARVLRGVGLRRNDNARLAEAVAAYRAALEERTRERNPRAWAITQVRLGSLLGTLAEREDDLARMEQAIEAYRAALEEWTVETEPDRHGRVQEMLDAAVALLNERKPR